MQAVIGRVEFERDAGFLHDESGHALIVEGVTAFIFDDGTVKAEVTGRFVVRGPGTTDRIPVHRQTGLTSQEKQDVLFVAGLAAGPRVQAPQRWEVR